MNEDGFIYPIPKKNADEYHKKKAKKTIDMFRLDDKGKLTEIIKQIESKKILHTYKKVIEMITTYKS